MDDHRFIRDFVVIAGKQPCFDGVEVGRRPPNGNLSHQIALFARLGRAFKGNGLGAIGRGHILAGRGNPAQKVFVVGDGMHTQVAVAGIWVKRLAAAHDIPVRVIGAGTK